MIKHSICLITTFCKNDDSDGVAQVLREMVKRSAHLRKDQLVKQLFQEMEAKKD